MELPLLGLQRIGCLLNHVIPLLVVLKESLSTQVLRRRPAVEVTHDLLN